MSFKKAKHILPSHPLASPEVIDWDGPWLIRMVSPPMAALIRSGVKKCEIIPVWEWVRWGVQGYIITAIYQGGNECEGIEKFIPPGITSNTRQSDKGKIMSIVILGPTPQMMRDGGAPPHQREQMRAS
jgi:hypothetical protein